MKQSSLFPFLIVAVLVAMWMPTTGQVESSTTAEIIAAELGGIRQALEDVATQVSDVRRSNDADLVLRQIALHEQRAAPIERELRINNDDVANHEVWFAETEELIAETEGRIKEFEQAGHESVPQELIDLRASWERNRRNYSAKLEVLRKRQMEVDDQVAKMRDEIEILEERLLELLE